VLKVLNTVTAVVVLFVRRQPDVPVDTRRIIVPHPTDRTVDRAHLVRMCIAILAAVPVIPHEVPICIVVLVINNVHAAPGAIFFIRGRMSARRTAIPVPPGSPNEAIYRVRTYARVHIDPAILVGLDVPENAVIVLVVDGVTERTRRCSALIAQEAPSWPPRGRGQ
jgi:hypothetical protein